MDKLNLHTRIEEGPPGDIFFVCFTNSQELDFELPMTLKLGGIKSLRYVEVGT